MATFVSGRSLSYLVSKSWKIVLLIRRWIWNEIEIPEQNKLIVAYSYGLPDGTKPLPEPILTYHQRYSVTFTGEQFHKKYSWT